jgi:8-amino-7-oxononanoate synthase
LIDWLWNRARTQVFSTALPPATCAAACAALAIVIAEPFRRDRLRRLAAGFREQLRARGLSPLGAEECPIVPVVLQSPHAAVAAGEWLGERGFLVGAIRPPTVPHGTSRLRITLTTAHGDDVLRQLVDLLESGVVA